MKGPRVGMTITITRMSREKSPIWRDEYSKGGEASRKVNVVQNDVKTPEMQKAIRPDWMSSGSVNIM
jgi:hypothetical protein